MQFQVIEKEQALQKARAGRIPAEVSEQIRTMLLSLKDGQAIDVTLGAGEKYPTVKSRVETVAKAIKFNVEIRRTKEGFCVFEKAE